MLNKNLEIWEKAFKNAKNFQSVFGKEVSCKLFQKNDVQFFIHFYFENKELCSVFKLLDGRFACFHFFVDESQPDGNLDGDGYVYLAESYEDIMSLGLTNEFRQIFNERSMHATDGSFSLQS